MNINKIDSDKRSVTLTFTASEINNLANALNQYIKEHEPYEDLERLHMGVYLVTQLVKNGCVDSVAVEHLSRIQNKINALIEKETSK